MRRHDAYHGLGLTPYSCKYRRKKFWVLSDTCAILAPPANQLTLKLGPSQARAHLLHPYELCGPVPAKGQRIVGTPLLLY